MNLNFAFYLSILLAINTCGGMWIAGKGKWQGWAMGLAGQPLWATYAIVTKGYGLLITCVMFSYVYGKNLWSWYEKENGPDYPENHMLWDGVRRFPGKLTCAEDPLMPFCRKCPDHEACAQGMPFGLVRPEDMKQ